MVDRPIAPQSEEPRARPRWGSLANEKSLLELLEGDAATRLQPAALTLAPINANLYSRRHSAHTCPTTEERLAPIPPPVPLRPPAVPKRMYIPAPPPTETKPLVKPPQPPQGAPPPIPPAPRSRPLPPVPPARNPQGSPNQFKNNSPKQQLGKAAPCAFEFGGKLAQEYSRMSGGVNTKGYHKPQVSPAACKGQHNPAKISMRQDSSVSSDSFSQTSSPSYTTKTMETPLLPPRTPLRQNGIANKIPQVEDDSGNTTITKSVSTPASLQTIVRFQNGSNMSLHHRIISDIRRPSTHYVRPLRHRFRYFQVILNAIALLAIGGGMTAYFKAYPLEVHILTNTTVNTSSVSSPIVIYDSNVNPAPGICLPVIVKFCIQHKVPYNFTVFPNFMGHFGQPEAQLDLEMYDSVVDVRCYELAALFLCSVFVPKCGPNGVLVRPCKSLCYETKRRCGIFFSVFGLELPEYLLKCEYFPESEDPDVCIGHREVKEAKIRASKPVCQSGFQCDVKRCIPKDWQCDGHIDCKDQSDELNCDKCGTGMIHCGEERCMAQEHMCDGKVDCPRAQDERNCLRLSERNGDEGHGQLEVFRPEQQQWVPACVSHWDTAATADKICSLLGYSGSNGSRLLLHGSDMNMTPPTQETTTIWRMHQNKRPKNLLREFGSCKTKTYPTVDITCTNYICGKIRRTYTYAERRSKRIVGGVASKPGDWPFLAALLGGPEEIFYCAGVLIADQWVLTASHCVGNHSDVSGWTIQLGITRRHAHSYYGQKMKVKRVVPHPKYNMGIAHDNDIALFQLSSRVTFHEHLLPVCLPPANKELRQGTVCTVIGWGKKDDTGMAEYEPEVNEVEVPVLNRDLCNTWMENKDLNVTDGMICAGYEEGGKDACQGDSGGPLLCRDEDDRDRWFVGGIVSWGIKCAHPHLPGVYAYVPKYIPWILEQMKLYGD